MILVFPYSVLCISTWAFERTHKISPLKFKMANGRHIKNRSSPYFFCFPTAFWTSTSGGFRIVSIHLLLLIFLANNIIIITWFLLYHYGCHFHFFHISSLVRRTFTTMKSQCELATSTRFVDSILFSRSLVLLTRYYQCILFTYTH